MDPDDAPDGTGVVTDLSEGEILSVLETQMPKHKSHKATLKRVKVTARGKVLVHPTGARHVMSGKSSKHRRHMRRARPLKAMDAARVHRSV